MIKRFFRLSLDICVLGFVAGQLFAGETVSVDGVRYEDIRWGPVNQGKVVIFHNHGVATVPLEKLPPDTQRRLGFEPKSPPPHPTPPGDSNAVITEILTPEPGQTDSNPPRPLSSQPRQLTGFVRFKAEMKEDEQVSRGLILELAELRNDALHVPSNIEMRPGLWKATGQMIFLRDCPLTNEIGALVRVYGLEVARVKEYRTFVYTRPPGPNPKR